MMINNANLHFWKSRYERVSQLLAPKMICDKTVHKSSEALRVIIPNLTLTLKLTSHSSPNQSNRRPSNTQIVQLLYQGGI